MKRAVSLLAAALAACAPQQKTPVDDPTARELVVVMALGVQETSQLKVGQWALYSVRSKASTELISSRVAVVADDKDTFWIENRTRASVSPGGAQRTMITKYQIDATAKPLQLWVGEPNSPRPTKVYPGKDASDKPIETVKPTAPDPRSKVEIAQETITVASGKPYECTRLTSKVTYPDGRETTLVTWCNKDVPFPTVHNGKSYGGVVRRTYGQHILELELKGTDAVPELIVPEK